MKKFGSKLSNRTKVIGGMTILLGIGTIISAIKDSKEIKEIEGDEILLEDISDGTEEVINAIDDAVENIVE